MKITKKLEKEILAVMDDYWGSYLRGDLQTWASYLPDHYLNIGTTKEEIWGSKKEIVDYTEMVIDQMVGMAEVRNKKTQIFPIAPYFMVHELGDLFIKVEEAWTFYAPTRVSSVLEKTKDGWKILHQHGSYPDSKTEEGEAFAFDELKAENKKLRDAIQSRTIELERKNRELEIEAALERVRSKTMAMHSSADVDLTVITLFEELVKLGLDKSIRSGIAIMNQSKMAEVWTGSTNPSTGNIFLDKGILDTGLHPLLIGIQEAWEAKKPTHTYLLEGDDLIRYFKAVNDTPDYSLKVDFEKLPEKIIHYDFFFPEGFLFAFSPVSFSEETARLFSRFAAVFAQTYRRFLDLQRAEAQAREAQIEAALERVRAQTMTMHNSEDVGKCIVKIFSELTALGVDEGARFGIGILNHDNENNQLWTASKDGEEFKMHTGNLDMTLHPLLVSARKAWKAQVPLHQYVLEGEDLLNYYQALNDAPDYPLRIAMEKLPARQFHYGFVFEHGFFYAFCPREFQPELIHITQRFSSQFAQTYRRYLDLVRAEAQAREAQIEAALERVRSRSLAMHKADELQEVVRVLAEELKNTGVILDTWGAVICTYFQDSKDVLHWTAAEDPANPSIAFLLPYFEDALYDEAWASKNRGDSYFAKVFSFDVKNAFFNHAFAHSDYRHLPDDYKQMILQSDSHGIAWAWAKNSAIMIPSILGKLPSEEEKEILIRFAKVFEQAYVRFMDLQKAEKQAKEALKQAALDRVRGEIASMRSTEDLNRITPVIWRELTSLDVPFIRCGVFIVDEASEVVEVYLSTPEGKALGVLHLPFDVNTQTTNTVKYWREKKVYREHWDAQTFIEWTQSMIEMGQVENFANYQGTTKIPDELHLHFVPFKQGMLYVGNVNLLPDEKIELVKTLAEAFSIAYARYEDFVRLEEAKSEIETALAELKATQAQLIQSEKMASLGELTAGIAHEIQNPLNFVNNFSEVTNELIEEMKEEMEKGDLEEVKALASDIQKNLEKIHHHGGRADAIVKGMLQHSRQSTAEKTATDINKLADEYLRLAYHGLRAKDKSFNVTLNTDFDPALTPIMVIPQDIGRVILNLITNAFYAVREKKKNRDNGYQPMVTISTQKVTGFVAISVEDNGNGIPQHILDKIFQPFFTTKPTGQGTGLGLSLSYDIVKAHEGKLEVETKEGIHTIFRITLPIKK